MPTTEKIGKAELVSKTSRILLPVLTETQILSRASAYATQKAERKKLNKTRFATATWPVELPKSNRMWDNMRLALHGRCHALIRMSKTEWTLCKKSMNHRGGCLNAEADL